MSLLKSPRASKKRSNNLVNNPDRTVAISVTGATASGSTVTATFDQPILLNGVPKYTTDVAGADAVSAVKTSATTIEITFDASVAAATALLIPYEEPAVRNASGGFVSTSTFPV